MCVLFSFSNCQVTNVELCVHRLGYLKLLRQPEGGSKRRRQVAPLGLMRLPQVVVEGVAEPPAKAPHHRQVLDVVVERHGAAGVGGSRE